MGFREVFPHVGAQALVNVRGKAIYPLTTGTFGAVDFLHSVLGEATDHLSQSEVDELDIALKNAESSQSGSTGSRGFFGGGSSSVADDFLSLLGQIPGQGSGLASQARDLQAQSQAEKYENERTRASVNTHFQGPPGSAGGPPGPGIPGMKPDFDAEKTIAKIMPILTFRDKVVKAISATVAKIPGLEKLVETISEKITLFIMSLLAPYIHPIIETVSKSLKDGSSTVVNASADQQYVVWNDPYCSDPTHSMLSKDHFSNYLNPIGGRVAVTILQYVVPRVLYAWEHPGVSVSEVCEDVLRAFHHPALRDQNCEIQRNMFSTVKKWVDENPDRNRINHILSSESVKAGRNHSGGNIHDGHSHSHTGGNSHSAFGGYGEAAGKVWGKIQSRDLSEMRDDGSRSRGISPQPEGFQNYGYSSGPEPSGRSGGQYLDTSRPTSGFGYQGAAPVDPYAAPQHSYQQPYQAQDPYAQPQYHQPPQNQQPAYGQQGGWSQGPPPPGPGYGGPPPFGGHHEQQQGGWSHGPPPQQGGWSQGPHQQGGWTDPSQQQQRPGWSHGPPQGPPHGGHG